MNTETIFRRPGTNAPGVFRGATTGDPADICHGESRAAEKWCRRSRGLERDIVDICISTAISITRSVLRAQPVQLRTYPAIDEEG